MPSRATPLRLQALQSQCRSPQLWLLSIWAGSLYLRASFYIVSARTYLQVRVRVRVRVSSFYIVSARAYLQELWRP